MQGLALLASIAVAHLRMRVRQTIVASLGVTVGVGLFLATSGLMIGSPIPATLATPASVSDRTDGKIAHLDGLNLSRAWCWRGIATALPAVHPSRDFALKMAQDHLDAALPHVTGDYMGEHWLASFALLALLA